MKNILINTLIFLMFIVGLGLMLYPTVSNLINERNMSSVIARYEEEINLLSDEERANALQAAREYNKTYPATFNAVDAYSINESAEYRETLNLSGNGLMASLKIDSIRVNLPIYHGISESVLQVAVGHLPSTSLPVGGKSTHAVLSAHTGLPSAKLFTDLDQLEIDDLFSITVLGETLIYRVDKISVVLPDDSDELRIFENEDYVTLVTCTPYGVNSHRLLVRGKRVFLSEEEAKEYFIEDDAVFLEKTLLIPIAVVPILTVYFFYAITHPLRKRKKKTEPPAQSE